MFNDTSDAFIKIDSIELRDRNRLASIANMLYFHPQGPRCKHGGLLSERCFLCSCENPSPERAQPRQATAAQTKPEASKVVKPQKTTPSKIELEIPTEKFQRRTEKIPTCEHGGYIISGFTRCGICTNTGSTVDSFGLFLESLYSIAGKAASKFKGKNVLHSYEDLRSEGMLKILLHLPLIQKAKNPEGMAFAVARGHYRNLKKKASTHREIAVSQLTVVNGDGDVEQADLDTLSQQFFEENGLDQERSAWKPGYLRKLDSIVEDAMTALHKEDSRSLSILKLAFGLDRDCGDLTLEQIGDVFGISRDTVARSRNKALKRLRELVTAALPTNVRFLRQMNPPQPIENTRLKKDCKSLAILRF
jgi:RNA polymerase sigma factor (sigma-70 family)